MHSSHYLPDTGSFAKLSLEEKKRRLDVMVKLWQSDTERRLEQDGHASFISAVGLDEYRYSVWLRFPEWERAVVVGQVIALPQAQGRHGEKEEPRLFSSWRHEPLLQMMPDWKRALPKETVFNISLRITPGGLGEGARWAVVMPKEMMVRYRPAWPSQNEWVQFTQSFDWLAVGVGFIHAMLNAR